MSKKYSQKVEDLGLEIINLSQSLFDASVELEEYDEAHEHRMERDEKLSTFSQDFGYRPSRDRSSGTWR